MKAFALIVSLLFVLTSKTIFSQEKVDYSKFPESTYWVNVEYKLAPSTFKDKILVVLCWDMTDPIGKSYFNKLQALSVKSQHLQLVSLVIGDEYHPNSLSDLKAFIQDNSINHPFGIAATLQPFANVKRESLPKVFVYTKEAEAPTIYGLSDGFSCDEIIYDLEKKLYDREVTKDYSYWQMKPNLATQDYAMPVLSYPSFLSTNETDKTIFVAENSQNRISGYGSNGVLKDLIGGNPGDANGNFESAKIGTVSGMDYDAQSKKLFFVDATANKIKVADFYYNDVSEFTVKRDLQSDAMYVDVLAMDTTLFVLQASPARISEFGMKGHSLLSEVDIQRELRINESVYKISRAQKGIYLITSHGRIFTIKNGVMEIFYSYVNWEDAAFDIVEVKKKIYILKPRKHEIVKYEKGKSKVIYSTALVDANVFDDIREDVMKLPHSLCAFNGSLLMSDLGNNMIRTINLKKKKATIFKPVFSEQMAMSKDAVSGGEQVFFEQTIFGSGTNQVEFVFELNGLKLFSAGRNEVALEETAGIELTEAGVTDKGFSIRITPREENGFAQMEIYLTLFDPEVPEVHYFKRAVLNIEYQVIPGEETSHSFFYRPNIKAY